MKMVMLLCCLLFASTSFAQILGCEEDYYGDSIKINSTTVVMTWMPPTENCDGSVLTDGHLFSIWTGTVSNQLSKVQTNTWEDVMVVLTNLSSTIPTYLGPSAVDVAGNESYKSIHPLVFVPKAPKALHFIEFKSLLLP